MVRSESLQRIVHNAEKLMAPAIKIRGSCPWLCAGVTAQMRVEQLETEFPSDRSPLKNDLGELFGTVGSNVNNQFQEVSSREML
jgi:hypothetical protein